MYFAAIPNAGTKPVVVVSNNGRNRALPDVIVARVTSAPKPTLASIVPIPDGEPVAGSVLCDDLFVLPKADLHRYVGGLSRPTMRNVDAGLLVALGIST